MPDLPALDVPVDENLIIFDTEFLCYTLKTEFNKALPITDLISIGMVDHKGNTYYAVSNEFNRAAAKANPWLAEHVLKQLPPESEWKPIDQIRQEIMEFAGGVRTEFHYWVASDDATLLRQLISPLGLSLWPTVWPMKMSNIAQELDDCGMARENMPPKPDNAHDALADALWTKDLLETIRAYKAEQASHTCCKPTGPTPT